MAKKQVSELILAHLAHQFFFSLKNLALPVGIYHGQLSLCTTSEKTYDPILRKLSDAHMDGQE